jgi:hypothetical protein
MPDEPQLPNNPIKRPFFVVIGVIALACGGLAAATGHWPLVAWDAVVLLGVAGCLYATRGGRNPRMFHAPADRRWRGDDR